MCISSLEQVNKAFLCLGIWVELPSTQQIQLHRTKKWKAVGPRAATRWVARQKLQSLVPGGSMTSRSRRPNSTAQAPT
ncbi:hypothetical protein TB1_016439 [Malus domestica]